MDCFVSAETSAASCNSLDGVPSSLKLALLQCSKMLVLTKVVRTEVNTAKRIQAQIEIQLLMKNHMWSLLGASDCSDDEKRDLIEAILELKRVDTEQWLALESQDSVYSGVGTCQQEDAGSKQSSSKGSSLHTRCPAFFSYDPEDRSFVEEVDIQKMLVKRRQRKAGDDEGEEEEKSWGGEGDEEDGSLEGEPGCDLRGGGMSGKGEGGQKRKRGARRGGADVSKGQGVSDEEASIGDGEDSEAYEEAGADKEVLDGAGPRKKPKEKESPLKYLERKESAYLSDFEANKLVIFNGAGLLQKWMTDFVKISTSLKSDAMSMVDDPLKFLCEFGAHLQTNQDVLDQLNSLQQSKDCPIRYNSLNAILQTSVTAVNAKATRGELIDAAVEAVKVAVGDGVVEVPDQGDKRQERLIRKFFSITSETKNFIYLCAMLVSGYAALFLTRPSTLINLLPEGLQGDAKNLYDEVAQSSNGWLDSLVDAQESLSFFIGLIKHFEANKPRTTDDEAARRAKQVKTRRSFYLLGTMLDVVKKMDSVWTKVQQWKTGVKGREDHEEEGTRRPHFKTHESRGNALKLVLFFVGGDPIDGQVRERGLADMERHTCFRQMIVHSSVRNIKKNGGKLTHLSLFDSATDSDGKTKELLRRCEEKIDVARGDMYVAFDLSMSVDEGNQRKKDFLTMQWAEFSRIWLEEEE